jgi:hypothetical protein
MRCFWKHFLAENIYVEGCEADYKNGLSTILAFHGRCSFLAGQKGVFNVP